MASMSTVASTAIVMATVLLSTLYPAHVASRMAVPDVTRRWKFPEPDGDMWVFDFPFTVSTGQVLGLYGFGNSAHITIQVARHLGIRVFVFTRSPGHQQHALELGAEWVGRAEDTPPEGIDSAIIFAPAGPLVPQALRVLNPGGTIALAGIYMTPIPEMPYDLLYFERTLRSVANSTRQDAIELLKLAEEIPIHTTVTTFPLEEANEVLLAMKESRINGDAILIP